VLLIGNLPGVIAVQYSNYTSDKNQIQFQYPSDWLLKEKTNRFEEGPEIQLSNPTLPYINIGISLYNDLFRGFGTKDLQSAVIDFCNEITRDYKYDYRTIESPTFFNIDGQRSGTCLYTYKDKYETNSVAGAVQNWITFVGGRGYVLDFFATPEDFDSPENTEIRDHFINSIKFLGSNNVTNSNVTNRFG